MRHQKDTGQQTKRNQQPQPDSLGVAHFFQASTLALQEGERRGIHGNDVSKQPSWNANNFLKFLLIFNALEVHGNM